MLFPLPNQVGEETRSQTDLTNDVNYLQTGLQRRGYFRFSIA